MELEDATIAEFIDTLRRIADVLEDSQTIGKRASPLVSPSLEPFPALKPKSYVEITGEVTDDPEIKEVDTRRGTSMIANFHITDGQNKVRVALWGDLSSEAGGLRIGDMVTLTNMSVKDPYEGTDQISSTRNTTLKRS